MVKTVWKKKSDQNFQFFTGLKLFSRWIVQIGVVASFQKLGIILENKGIS